MEIKNLLEMNKDTKLKSVPIPDYEYLDGTKELPTTTSSVVDLTSILSNAFVPDWDNKPIERKPILTLDDTSILTYQNMSAIIALPGIGKSSICEAILSALLNPSSDSLGFGVGDDCKAILYVDMERTDDNTWKSFYNVAKRSQLAYRAKIENVKIVGLRNIPRLSERLLAIEYFLNEKPYDVLLLDGAGDLVTDTNDLLQAIECRIKLREWTVKYNLSILTTLHPNPNSTKPRGHIGSEICREAECVLIARKGEGETRVLTTNFEHGKNRNGGDVTVGFTYSESDHMFVSCEVGDKDKVKEEKTRLKALSVASKIPLTAFRHTDLIECVEEITGLRKASAKNIIVSMIEYGLMEKGVDSLYRKTG